MRRREFHQCPECGKQHNAATDACSACIRKAEREVIEAGRIACVRCGGEKERGRVLISPYCRSCAAEAQKDSRRCGVQVKKSIAKGDIPPLDGTVACIDCGSPARHYDHRDYTKPLLVAPVCCSCNIKRGPADRFAGVSA